MRLPRSAWGARIVGAVLAAFLLAGPATGCGAEDRNDAGATSTNPKKDAGKGDQADPGDQDAGDDASADDEAGSTRDGGAGEDANGEDALPPGDGGPYSSVETLQGQPFRDALRNLISNQTALGYDGARDAMLGVSGTFDLTNGKLECIYTGKQVLPDGTRTPNGFNTEHSWPQSLGASAEPARSDLHHLFPVDEAANTARGNLPFADTDCSGATCSFDTGGSQRGPISGGAAIVFEVRPARRGDIARAIFYFSVRYNLAVDPDEENALRGWHTSDPPDQLEQDRNDAIEALQHNRNPFIDRPDFVDKIADF